MSVNIEENNYRIVRNHDPQFQAMTRVTDANNVYDIRQEYIKNGTTRNDFLSQKEYYDRNVGILNDGKYVDMSNFFTETVRLSDKTVTGKPIKYFKFKTNHVLNENVVSHIKDTYIDKTNVKTIYDIRTDTASDGRETYSIAEEKLLIEDDQNSYPLQRADKLAIYELDSLLIYINGRKIPDNEIFIYAGKSFTDVFIPEKYIPGELEDSNSIIDAVFNIDYRQPGSELLYFRDTVSGSSFTINFNDTNRYQYRYERSPISKIKKEYVVVFVNGKYVNVRDIEISEENNTMTVNMPSTLDGADVELYVLGNIVYRHKTPDITQINNEGTRVHFYLPDDYFVDVLSGPITKSAISFYYDGERVDDTKLIQTSRFSFEFSIDKVTYTMVDTSQGFNSNIKYYVRDELYNYHYAGDITSFEEGKLYFKAVPLKAFDETKIDFFIEDIGFKIDEYGFTTYGDDYYLLNMLGVKRCVDRMKGTYTYSVFDKPLYDISFREVLSKNGDLFDVEKAIAKYNMIKSTFRSPFEKTKYLIQERPTLIRRLFEQFKNPSKKAIVYGNAKDVILSSVTKFNEQGYEEYSYDNNGNRISTVKPEIYYKVYVNHLLMDSDKYTIEHEIDHDVITIKKEVLLPGTNRIELFQFDLTYKSKSVFKDNVNNGTFESTEDENGNKYFIKTYNFSDLPFDSDILTDDICAIEQVRKEWFGSEDDEFYYYYPTEENIGYRPPKQFSVINRTETTISIRICLHCLEETGGSFFLMGKQYNVVEERTFDNSDCTYMEQNDLMIPIYTTYVEYGVDASGHRIPVHIDDFIPYINNSEPIITIDGREQIFGKDYTFINPETNDQVASSYIILKTQPKDESRFVVQFNSSKTNILIVGYDDLEIENRYGLVYLSELPYPVSPDYMNIYVNGEKLSSFDIDILSDKLVRFKNITRPIRSILVTTNSQYKNSELQDFIDLYRPSKFELLLEQIFWNCDPSKKVDANHPDVDMVYKVNPYYSEFTGVEIEDLEEFKTNNPFYVEYINTILENAYRYDKNTIFTTEFPKPKLKDVGDENYEAKLAAWEKANLFFDAYKGNHGLEPYVDSVLQAENPFEDKSLSFVTDTLEIMYLNWLARSKKTRTYGWKADDIDSKVLKFFSVYENTIIDNRVDIVVDSGRTYDGLKPEVINEIYQVDENGQIVVKYPGLSFNMKRQWFFETMLDVMSKSETPNDYQNDPETGESPIIKSICLHKNSNILYPVDINGIGSDNNGIVWTGTDVDICSSDTTPDFENQLLSAAIRAEQNIRNNQ